MRRFLIAMMLALPAFAQSNAEFGRYSAGEVNLLTKSPSHYSGSLRLTRGGANGFGGSIGGAVVKDKVWFFATGDHVQTISPALTFTGIPTARQTVNTTATPTFLSLKSTSILSPNSFVTVSVSKTQ